MYCNSKCFKTLHMSFRIINVVVLHILCVCSDENSCNLLTLSEKQRIVNHELQLIRALDTDTHIPGFSKLDLYKGETISMLNIAILCCTLYNDNIINLINVHAVYFIILYLCIIYLLVIIIKKNV